MRTSSIQDEAPKNQNIIRGIIKINKDDLGEDIKLINPYQSENVTIEIFYPNKKEEEDEEDEVKMIDNVEIKINGKSIEPSYYYEFDEEGEYEIEYLFKKNVTYTEGMFYDCQSLIKLDLSNFKTQEIIDISSMFNSCISLKELNLSNFNTTNVTNMQQLFSKCESLETLNLSNFNTEKVTNMSCMFKGCKSLKNLNVLNFITINVKDMNSMFCNCKALKELNLSKFNT